METERYVPIVALTPGWVLFVHAKELLDEANPVERAMLPLAASPTGAHLGRLALGAPGCTP